MYKRLTIAETLARAGRKLQWEYGSDPIPVAELRRETASLGGHQESGILPSDFCYNRTNDGISFTNKPLFVYVGRARYEYVGLNHSYNGPVFHKPKGQAERQVGEWKDGNLTLL